METQPAPENVGTPSVQIVAVNQRNARGESSPANLHAIAGQIDIFVKVNGYEQLKSVSVTLTVGEDSIAQSQSLDEIADSAITDAAARVVAFSFNTAAFNAAGIPALHNRTMVISAMAARTSAVGAPLSASVGCQLANADAVVVFESFAPYTDAEGKATLTSKTDPNGRQWRGGSVTVTALPIVYSDRKIVGGSIAISIPGAIGSAVITPTAPGPLSATWSATSNRGLRVTGLKLLAGELEADGVTPRGVTPVVVGKDSEGNELNLGILNFTQPC
jgi:hypothetical protein